VTTPAPVSPARKWPLLIAGLFLAGLLFAGWYFWWGTRPDPVAAAHANVRGIGYMEQFEYEDAVREFEEVVRLDPGWLPGQINLGIALLNNPDKKLDPNEPDRPENREVNLRRALGVFQKVLEIDPKNPYAHHCIGIIILYQGRQLEKAVPHFKAVTEIDPKDAFAWYLLGHTLTQVPDADKHEAESKRYLQKALDLNPYLNSARYQIAQHPFEHDEQKSKALLAEFEQLTEAKWATPYRTRYMEMGRYAEVLGAPPAKKPVTGPIPLFEQAGSFKVVLAEGTRWAKEGDLTELTRAVRERFGGTIVRLDYNGDGKPDLLLLSAVVRGGAVRDLLLRNDGGGTFTDVTEAAGLGNALASFGCAVADYDNDGRPDLLLTGPAGIRLFRNKDGQRFEDRSAEAGFDKVTGVFLGAGWIDLDQDADLDLLVARYAATAEGALNRLKGGKGDEGGGLLVFINIGEALPINPVTRESPGLTCKFRPATGPEALLVRGPVVTFLASDLDADRDVDLLVFVDGQAPVTVLNDRLLRFHRDDGIAIPAHEWNGGLVLDANHDEQSDLFLLPAGKKPIFLLSQRDTPADGTKERFAPGATDSPPLVQAQAVDLDLDGWMDVVGLSQAREPVFLQNDGTGRLVLRKEAIPSRAKDLLGIAVCDVNGDGVPDVLLWSASEGLQMQRNRGNGNHALRVVVTGKHDPGKVVRSNADGIGALITAHVGQLATSIENTTLSAGLGQSRLPLTLGLGQAGAADVVRFRWTDGVPQAELNQTATGVRRFVELNRRTDSCPLLLTWDGERFTFITDFLGAGSMGELAADGSTRPPRPEESIKIEPGRLVPRNGRYVLKIAEPMDEILYLDHLRLEVIDHPADVAVFPDERFATADPQPTQELLAFRQRIFPVRAVDHRGKDVTAILRERDGKVVDDFAQRSWLGFAEDHFVELDFGDRLAQVPPGERLFLVLAGWTDYPYPESIYAAEQAGVPVVWPTLEKLGSDGKWQSLGEIGLPAGLPRVMTTPMRDLAGSASCKLRLRTNLQIYWDQIYLAPVVGTPQSHRLEVARATLAHRGFMQEVAPRSGGPVEYDDERTEPVAVTRWQGRLTRTGDVTELLRKQDDRFVLCGPGDEITVEFDARDLPPVPAGHVRSFVLRTWGFCKDASLFTHTSGSIDPLPFRAMKNYPPAPGECPDRTEDRRNWHTRPAGR
jgi:tetratricopeptide (TPR) repeat protein